MLLEPMNQLRRIYTDGRSSSERIKPSFLGYSICPWVGEDHNGRFDVLLVESRGIKSPRSYDSSGIPFHRDGQTVIQERIYPDKANDDIVHNEITTIYHALTRPWTVTRSYHRVHEAIWIEVNCTEGNQQIRIGEERYNVSGDGCLIPTRRGQPAPDLRVLKKSRQ